ncbi:MAG: hypothetical protein Q7K42_04625, partial [Candidatus Diapherotrites archaeon]|nr:hypothetical protein [Candidatus Diapherotrites archaeon]
MPVGRKSRNRRFSERAKQFARELPSSLQAKKITRFGKTLVLGTGKNKRLVVKTKHFEQTKALQDELKHLLEKEDPEQKEYQWVFPEAQHFGNFSVQEFFNKPTLSQLKKYFSYGKQPGWKLSKNDVQLCKQFLGQKENRDLTLEKLETATWKAEAQFNLAALRAERKGLLDIYEDGQKGALIGYPSPNIVVLGTNRDGRIRL